MTASARARAVAKEDKTNLGGRTRKHARLVKGARTSGSYVHKSAELFNGGGFAGGVLQGAKELRARLGESAKEEDVGEVDVLEALGMLSDTSDEAFKVGSLGKEADVNAEATTSARRSTHPFASLLVEVIVADVDRDGGVKSCGVCKESACQFKRPREK